MDIGTFLIKILVPFILRKYILFEISLLYSIVWSQMLGGYLYPQEKNTSPNHHIGNDYNYGSSSQPRKLIFGMQHYFNQTKYERQPSFFLIGRRPYFKIMEDDLNFFNRKTTTILFVNGRCPQFIFSDGRQPQYFVNRRQTQYFVNGKQP